MIRITEIQDALLPLVGWEQAFTPEFGIADALTVTESGLTYQGAHPLVTLDNVRSIMPDDYAKHYPIWDATTQYAEGDKVQYQCVVFIATEDNIATEPPALDFDGNYLAQYDGVWQPYNPLSDYLLNIERRNIAQAVQTFLQTKSLLKESKNLLERRTFFDGANKIAKKRTIASDFNNDFNNDFGGVEYSDYNADYDNDYGSLLMEGRTFFDGAGRINATLPNGQRLVGFEITPAYSMGVTAKIERIGLQMVGATGTVRVYLFHSSQVDPIAMADLEFTKTNGGFQWFKMSDWYMPYISDNTDSGGAWYLCYNQADLPDGMEAINVSKDWSREPCGTCNRGNLNAWRELTKYINIAPFKVPSLETFAEYPEMWDIEDNIYTNTTNYGLNVEVSVGCDLTDFIIEQRQIFATVIQRQMAATILRTLALNPHVRVNRNQSNASKNELLYEVDGNTEGRATGLGYDLRKAYEALDLDTRGIDRICLTCRPVGARYRTV